MRRLASRLLPRLLGPGEVLCLSQCGNSAGGVDLLNVTGWLRAQRRIGVDAIPIPIRRDHPRGYPPLGHLLLLGRWLTKLCCPGLAVGERGVEHGGGALLDELFPFFECVAHVLLHGAGGVRDDTRDQPW